MIARHDWYYANRPIDAEEYAAIERRMEQSRPAAFPVLEQPKRTRRCEECDGIFLWNEATASGKPPTKCSGCRNKPRGVTCVWCGTEFYARNHQARYCSTDCSRAGYRQKGKVS